MAFHGTSSENAFSVLQNGLKSFSNTRQMRSGAIFGDGVYFCEDHKVAKTFAQSVGSVTKFSLVSGVHSLLKDMRAALQGKSKLLFSLSDETVTKCSFSVVFHCELIKHPDNFVDSNKESTKGAYYVVQDPQHIRLRRVLIYYNTDGDTHQNPDPSVTKTQIQTSVSESHVNCSSPTTCRSGSSNHGSSESTIAGMRHDLRSLEARQRQSQGGTVVEHQQNNICSLTTFLAVAVSLALWYLFEDPLGR